MPITNITSPDAHGPSELEQPAAAPGLQRDTVLAMTAVLVGTLAALVYASVTGISSWSQLVVLGGIVLVTISVMIAIDPLRGRD